MLHAHGMEHFFSTRPSALGDPIIFLDLAGSAPPGEIGTKAANLTELLASRLPVPAGFCIPSSAADQHLQGGDVPGRLEAVLACAGECGPDERRALLSDLHQAIVEAPMPESLAAAIDRAYRMLQSERLAVRSSAT